MKLRNKITGEIRNIEPITIGGFRSLAELNEEWEDYEEKKEETFWYISEQGVIKAFPEYMLDCKGVISNYKAIGNYFRTKEEAERAVEKLKALKRLEEKGFSTRLIPGIASGEIRYTLNEESDETERDIRTVFGGEDG